MPLEQTASMATTKADSFWPPWLQDAGSAVARSAALLGSGPRDDSSENAGEPSLQARLAAASARAVAAAASEDAAAVRRRAEEEQERQALEEEQKELLARPALSSQLRCWRRVVARHDGFALSREERFRGGSLVVEDPHGASSLGYGEVGHFFPFLALLRETISLGNGVRRDGTATFVDLGCGTGNALVAAALLPLSDVVPDLETPDCGGGSVGGASPSFFAECLGIEYLASLEAAARSAGEELGRLALGCGADGAGSKEDEDAELMAAAARNAASISSLRADVLDPAVDWSSHDVVYAASTLFSSDLIEGIERRALSLRPGTVLVTLAAAGGPGDLRRFSCGTDAGSGFDPEPPGSSSGGGFKYATRGPFRMSWGLTMARINVRQATFLDELD
eukprot:TRINITY_DN29245_c0_g2_i1.p1 TRINITY_DN29245_c0_g2~~TRINITY_DN29245_c0_g2_i1.p1  ORF type:complete len:394 (-),score=105.80 TRINITY_DN29245_c0_g2_i1:32-1213(-)